MESGGLWGVCFAGANIWGRVSILSWVNSPFVETGCFRVSPKILCRGERKG